MTRTTHLNSGFSASARNGIFFCVLPHEITLPSLSGALSAITVHAFSRCLVMREDRHCSGPHVMPAPYSSLSYGQELGACVRRRLFTPAAGICVLGAHLLVLGPITGILSLSAIRRDACFPSISPSSIQYHSFTCKAAPHPQMTPPQALTLGNFIISDRILSLFITKIST